MLFVDVWLCVNVDGVRCLVFVVYCNVLSVCTLLCVACLLCVVVGCVSCRCLFAVVGAAQYRCLLLVVVVSVAVCCLMFGVVCLLSPFAFATFEVSCGCLQFVMYCLSLYNISCCFYVSSV